MDSTRSFPVCARGIALGVGLLGAAPAFAQQSGAQQSGAEQSGTQQTGAEQITVTAPTAAGGGLIAPRTDARSVSAVSSDFIARQAPTENAFQLVSLLPGANAASADPLGFSTQVGLSVRGLGQDEIGALLEGMPLNDAAYYDSYPSQFADSENIEAISLTQGSADLDAPLLNAAGGVLSLTLREPSKVPGGFVDTSYGSYHTNREFIRLDSGTIAGFRGFLSYSHGERRQCGRLRP